MLDQAPVLVILLPLFGAFVAGLAAMRHKALARPVALVALTLTVAAAVAVLLRVAGGGVVDYALGGWGLPGGIVLRIDGLNAPILVLISAIGLAACWYSGLPAKSLSSKLGPFYTLFLLLITGLLGITITNDAFNLYVFLEITALSSYALLALGNRRSLIATIHYLLQGSVGASFYLLGVGYLYMMTGTLNMSELAVALPDLYESRAIQVACALIVIGAWVKMGLFPFHSWLPNAYSAACTSVAPLIAPLTTKISVYVMIRLMYSVFTPTYMFEVLNWRPIVLWIATIAIVSGSVWALMQRDLRRIVCWIMVAEIGYMVGGAWLGVRSGLTGATYHLLNDAVMTMTMFCFAGILLHHCKIWSIDDMHGLFRRMPLTMGAFVVAACSMIGIPPTCGFFSKCYLLLGCAQTETWHLGAALIFASLCNAVIFYRIFEHAFFADEKAAHGSESKVLPPQSMEPPASMLVPLLVGAAALLFLGIFGSRIVDAFLIHAPWGAGV